MDKLLTIGQVSEALGVSDETLRNWDRDGSLPSVKTKGGHRRWRQSDVDNFMGIPEEDNSEKPICIYGRVSSHEQKQKGDLDRQL